jgi:SHS2 domain-containing protein
MKIESDGGFELFDHTADIGVNAWGKDISEAYEFAAISMYSIIFHGSPPKVEPKGEFRIKLKSSDIDQLLVDWLDEILFIYSTEHIVLSNFKIEIDIEKKSLDAIVSGEIVSDEYLIGTCEIKAVTYHMLSVKKTDTRWDVKVLFDI